MYLAISQQQGYQGFFEYGVFDCVSINALLESRICYILLSREI